MVTVGDDSTERWQNRLMPWMVLMPTILIGAFIVLATIRMSNFESFMYSGGASAITNSLPIPQNLGSDSSLSNNMEYLKLYTLTSLEEHSLNKRYNQASALTMSTIYTKYMGFFTGMILAIVGAVFIISKIKEDSSKFSGSYKDIMQFKLASSSPGIIFSTLGTVLMSITILSKGYVKVDDMPLYLNHYNLNMPETGKQQIVDTAKANRLNINDTRKEDGKIPQQEAEASDPNN